MKLKNEWLDEIKSLPGLIREYQSLDGYVDLGLLDNLEDKLFSTIKNCCQAKRVKLEEHYSKCLMICMDALEHIDIPKIINPEIYCKMHLSRKLLDEIKYNFVQPYNFVSISSVIKAGKKLQEKIQEEMPFLSARQITRTKMYDCIIIGGGHNGLITAAYLAKAGKKVCVLERRDVLGGCASTQELWPGFKISPAAYVISLLLPEIQEDLQLEKYGFKILKRNPSSITPTLGGKTLVLGPDQEENRKSIAQFNSLDAVVYPQYEEMLTNIAASIEPLMKQIPPTLPSPYRKLSGFEKIKNWIRGFKFARNMNKLLANNPYAVEILTGSATNVLNRWFTGDVLKATLATDAIIGAFIPPSAPGSAYVLLHHVMGEAGGQRGVWGYVQGGMGGLADSLEKACIELGVMIKRNAEVKKIKIDDNHTTYGVICNDNYRIKNMPTMYLAKAVASSIDATQTLDKFIAPGKIGIDFREAVSRIDYSSASGKINLALDGLPEFTGIDPELLKGTIHISPSMNYIKNAYRDADQGDFSKHPVLEIVIPSMVDETLAPEGKHVMSIFVQYAPYKLFRYDGKTWDDIKDVWVNNCLNTLEKYAPNIREKILHIHALTPLDLEREYRLTGGNIMQGAMPMNQLGSMRPMIGWSDHRTPIKGLYLCGASTHPGGGVMGACGRNAAKVILSDLRRL